MSRVLIVDDEPNVRLVLEHALKHEGYQVTTAANGVEALNLLAQIPFDLLLLDLQMEPIGGLHVLSQAKQQDQDIVVIILTAYSTVESAVEALRLGAFDYMFKPTSPKTIRERVQDGLHHRQQARQQRSLMQQITTLQQTLNQLTDNATQTLPAAPTQRFIYSGGLVIDTYHRQATMEDTLLELTTTEFDLLLCLVKSAPNPIAPRQLVNQALGYDANELEARDIIKWHIYQLRQKIEPQHIKTVRHKGYMWSKQ